MTNPVNIPALIDSARPVVQIENGQAITTSIEVARVFGKQHRHVMDAIRTLLTGMPEDRLPNFRQTPYTDPQNGQTYPAYHLTKDGVALLTFGFTGKKAMAFKLAYIDAFNRMEAELTGHHIADVNKMVANPPAPAQPALTMPDPLSDTGITPDMIADIVASTTNTLVATLQQKRKLIAWPDIIEAVQNPQTDMAFPDLTALLHACVSRFERSIDSEAYSAIERRAKREHVSTAAVSFSTGARP